MKSVLVTGGVRRIGGAISERLRLGGWHVITTSSRPGAGADITADLSTEGAAAALYSEVMRMLGGVPPDALVNNAALFTGDDGRIETVNFISPKKLTILMGGRETSRGSVVNILDATSCASAGNAYARSKAMLADFTKSAAALFSDTINVNAVSPGPVLPPEGVHIPSDECPAGRPGVEDVAKAVEYLLSARFTTGCILPVDGGCSLF